MTALSLGQYQLADSVVFGTRSPWLVHNDFLVQQLEVAEGGISNHDVAYPNEDGTKFGVDFRTGMTLAFDMSLWKKGVSGLDDASILQSAWKDPKYRTTPNAVTTLRICRGGRTRRVYGRPRKFKTSFGAIERGWAPITADFQCADESFYDDTPTIQEIGLVNPPTAGLTLPTTVPLHLSQYAAAYTNIQIDGDRPTWPVFRIDGPVTNPTLAFDNTWTAKLLLSLDHTQHVIIDTYPWARTTIQDLLINRSGVYTATSPMMREMALIPGLHDLVYTGIDPTLTSNLTITWRPAWSTP